MAISDPLQVISLTVSGNNLSATTDDYLFVKCGATEGTVVPAAARDCPLGINLETGKNGDSIKVLVTGIGKVRCQAIVKAGQLLRVYTGAADGRAYPSVNTQAHGAMALENGAADDIVSCIITRGFGS